MRDAVELWLINALARSLPAGVAIDREQPLFSLGVDSIQLAVLTADLADNFAVQLDSTLFYEAPTISEAALRVAALCHAVPAAVQGIDPTLEAHEPLAIVGISCRMPRAPDKDAFWRLLEKGHSGIGPKNTRRSGTEGMPGPQVGLPLLGGYLDVIDEFDAAFFRIAPAEAAEMDPQQRLLLQTAWEALDDAGVPPLSLKGADVGVFVGISHSDYSAHHFTSPDRVSGLSGTGNALSIAANRISYALDLRGPSVAVDTACSSSLTALHLACASLRDGECETALVGGVNVIIGTTLTTALFRAGMLSPDSACMPFEARANGYVRGEGCGVVVVKRLSQALSDNDRIYAVLKGSAVNQDGRGASLTAPSLRAQEALLRTACRRAGVEPAALDYVEAHGTGTPLGDPVEAVALGRVCAVGRPPERALLIGSVKANIGHLEAAAGMAGLIKACLALYRGVLPAQPGFREGNPRIDFAALGLLVADETRPWPQNGGGLCGVSSFGFGGTNAHVVLQAPPPVSICAVATRPVMVALHAPSADALRRQARRWSKWLSENPACEPGMSLAAIGDTSVFRRSRMAATRSFVAASQGELAQLMEQFAATNAEITALVTTRPQRVVFHYPAALGDDVNWDAVLSDPDPLFRSAVAGVRDHLPAIAETCPAGCSTSEWERLAALQVGVAMLLRSHGIIPDAACGSGPGCTIAALLYRLSAPEAAGDTVIAIGPALPGSVAAWRPGLSPSHGVLLAVAALFDAGHPIRRRFVPGRTPQVVGLPPYTWQPERFWLQHTAQAARARSEPVAVGLQDVMNIMQPAHGRQTANPPLRVPDVQVDLIAATVAAGSLAASVARGAGRGMPQRARAVDVWKR